MSFSSPLLPPLLGGGVLGLTVFWNAVLKGKVTGVSGELRRMLDREGSSTAFIAGLVGGGFMLSRTPLAAAVTSVGLAELPVVPAAAAGFALGVGARVANGCTSGHALCGLSRLSRRSLAATALFMGAAIATATALHGSPLAAPLSPPVAAVPPVAWQLGALVAAALAPPALALAARDAPSKATGACIARVLDAALGTLFAAGLLLTGMADRARIASFLDVRGGPNWDYASMPLVFAGALPPATLAFSLVRNGAVKPVLAGTHSLPTASAINKRLALGSVTFGVAWGWLGLCPGPALVNFGAFPMLPQSAVVLGSIAAGISFGGLF